MDILQNNVEVNKVNKPTDLENVDSQANEMELVDVKIEAVNTSDEGIENKLNSDIVNEDITEPLEKNDECPTFNEKLNVPSANTDAVEKEKDELHLKNFTEIQTANIEPDKVLESNTLSTSVETNKELQEVLNCVEQETNKLDEDLNKSSDKNSFESDNSSLQKDHNTSSNEINGNTNHNNKKSLIESITSDWALSDAEVDDSDPKVSETNQVTSAEMIALEWDDNSEQTLTVENNSHKDVNTKENHKNNVVNKELNKLDLSDPTEVKTESAEIICAVVDEAIDPQKSADNNIIILQNISELNLSNSQNTGITIISVDHNPNMDVTETNTSNVETSFVIHELDIDTSKNNYEVIQDSSKNQIGSNKKENYRKHQFGICTPQEIANEIDLAVSKQKGIEVPSGGDIIFKNEIIKRLASKILPKKISNNVTNTSSPVGQSQNTPKTQNIEINKRSETSKQVSDQELLEILEGDAEIDVYNLQKDKDLLSKDDSEIILKDKESENSSAILPEDLLNKDSENLLKGKELVFLSKILGGTDEKKKNETKMVVDPDTEREIALQQLSEMPGDDYSKKIKKGKLANLVLTNVPKTIIIEKAEKSGGDPFNFEENAKTVGTPNIYGPNEVKTYSRKSTTTEPSIKEIVVPKELLDLEKESVKKSRGRSQKSDLPGRKSSDSESGKKKTPSKIENKQQKKSTPKDAKTKKESNVEEHLENAKSDQKIFLTDNASNILISKRSRIIKRKIIWDPSLKFPTYVMPTISKNKVIKPKDSKELISKRKMKEIGNNIKSDSISTSEKKENIETTDEVIDEDKLDETGSSQLNETDTAEDSLSKKRRSTSLSPQKKKRKLKRVSEIDKLLMDEGALNMLYSVEQDEEIPLIKEKQKVISLDKFSKEMSKKKKMIMSALTTTPEVAPKALRKKEQPPRKKSRDSVLSVIQSPPPSPNSMFPPRAEASRIIRRHSSSSSFSSECMSPRRLSSNTEQVNEKQPKSSTEIDKLNIEPTPKKSENKPVAKKMRLVKVIQSRTLRKRGVPIFVKKHPSNIYMGKTKQKPDNKTNETDDFEHKTNSSTDEFSIINENSKYDSLLEKKNKEQEITGSTKTKSIKKDLLPKCPSPTTESYSQIVKSLDNKKENDEKQRTSSRPNAGSYNYKEISVRKYDELVQIILTPQSTKIKNAFNVQTMREICAALSTFKKDPSCKAVLLTSTGSVFCRGLDYTPLYQQNAEKRKSIAIEMANSVKEFVRAIIQFPRPVIAGVQGAASGLGVAILPLCDLVFVSDKATFSMNHCKLGCLPEGAASISLPYVTSHAIAAELLIAGHTLTAMEALRHGLASRVLWPEGYFQELIPLCKTIASQSSQSMDSTKILIRHSLAMKVEAALESETHLLVQQWTSSECQQLLKKAIEQDAW